HGPGCRLVLLGDRFEKYGRAQRRRHFRPRIARAQEAPPSAGELPSAHGRGQDLGQVGGVDGHQGGPTMSLLLELLFQLIVEAILQVVFEVAVALGWESLKHATGRTRPVNPILSGFGHLLMGLLAGVLSVWLFPERLTTRQLIPGLSLVLAPVLTGMTMQ